MAKHYDKQFKIDAVQYYHDHKRLGLIELCFKILVWSLCLVGRKNFEKQAM